MKTYLWGAVFILAFAALWYAVQPEQDTDTSMFTVGPLGVRVAPGDAGFVPFAEMSARGQIYWYIPEQN